MLRREVELRTSTEIMEAMEEAEKSDATEWMDVAEKVQHQVVQEYHEKQRQEHGDESYHFEELGVHDLRLAALRHPEIAFWVRFNRARQGKLKVGDKAPNVPLLQVRDGQPAMLLGSESCDNDDQRTVVVAGSLS